MLDYWGPSSEDVLYPSHFLWGREEVCPEVKLDPKKINEESVKYLGSKSAQKRDVVIFVSDIQTTVNIIAIANNQFDHNS